MGRCNFSPINPKRAFPTTQLSFCHFPREAAYQMFCTKGLIWRIVSICTLWFSSGFSFYGLTLGVNALPFDRYYITAIISTVEIPARALNRPLLASPLGTFAF